MKENTGKRSKKLPRHQPLVPFTPDLTLSHPTYFCSFCSSSNSAGSFPRKRFKMVGWLVPGEKEEDDICGERKEKKKTSNATYNTIV